MTSSKPIIDVIVPVYGGYDETVACIESVFSNPQHKTICNLIIINDCSPEPAIDQYLENLAPAPNLTVLKNAENLGFVGTVNRGMSLSKDNHVLLLNSDAEVSGDWLDRIYAHYLNDTNIATITPFSNNATICSFPNTCKDNELPLGKSIAKIDAAFAKCGPGINFDVPTGVGFCMFISRPSLDAAGLFDVKAFGKGYGEENDFCRKAAELGFRNVLCGDVFVFHAGSVSFAGTQNEKIKNALQVLEKRYPDYPGLVQQHILQNSAKQLRVSVLLELLASDQRDKVLHIGHGIGGGVQHHIDALRGFLTSNIITLELKPIDNGNQVRLDLSSIEFDDALHFSLPDQYPELLDILNYMGISRVHFHHFMFVPECLHTLASDLNTEFYFTIHDYYCINGNPTLTDKKGYFCGDLETQQRDTLCLKNRSLPNNLSAPQWREKFSQLLAKADCIIAPSVDCKQRFQRDFKQLEIIATPHEDYYLHPPQQRPTTHQDKALKVLTLGALSPEKGADVIEQCAKHLAVKYPHIKIELLGYAYRELDPSIVAHGAYSSEKLQDKLAQIKPDIIWFPAQWPETYSYTLSAALEYGCKIAITDLGAPADRLAGRENSWSLPWQSSPQQWAEFFNALAIHDTKTLLSATKSLAPVEYDSTHFYTSDYLEFNIKKDTLTVKKQPDLTPFIQGNEITTQLSNKEQLLVWLYKVYTHKWCQKLVKFIPVHLLRKVKRALSNQPMNKLIK